MKALKITLALIAIAVLTVSGVQAEERNLVENDKPSYKTTDGNNLIAHRRGAGKVMSRG